MLKKNWVKALISILLAEGVGVLSSFLAGDIKTVYAFFRKPPLAPPDWVYGVVWPIMFLLMGLAAYLIYINTTADRDDRRSALEVYLGQLIVNFCWSPILFNWRFYWGSVAVLVLLIFLICLTIVRFAKIDKRAAALLIPYLLWCLFALYLNIGVALLNG